MSVRVELSKSLTLLDLDKDGEYTLLPKIALYTMAVNLNDLNEGWLLP